MAGRSHRRWMPVTAGCFVRNPQNVSGPDLERCAPGSGCCQLGWPAPWCHGARKMNVRSDPAGWDHVMGHVGKLGATRSSRSRMLTGDCPGLADTSGHRNSRMIRTHPAVVIPAHVAGIHSSCSQYSRKEKYDARL